MCDDPTCDACVMKTEVDKEAHPLAKVFVDVLKQEMVAGRVNKDRMPLVGLRACAGVMAGLCHGAGNDRMLALSRAMNDLAELFNQMNPQDNERAVVLDTFTKTGDELAGGPKNTVH